MESFSRLFRDFRYAFRSLRRSSAMATAAVATLALGIGANTAIFSVLEGVVLKPLPFPQPDRLVIVALFNRSLGYATYLSYPDFVDWQGNASSFEQIAAFTNDGFDLTAPGLPEHLEGKEVSANFFSTLGVQLAFGRSFSPDEDRSEGAPAAVISNRIAQERFAGGPAALGRALALNGVDHTVVGVLKPGFRFDEKQADVYTPIARRNPMYIDDRTVHDILCIARLRPGVGVGQARAEMNTVQENIDELHPNTERGLGASVVPLKQELIGDISGTLLLLLGAVGLVLLIAGVNVANLMLARSATRSTRVCDPAGPGSKPEKDSMAGGDRKSAALRHRSAFGVGHRPMERESRVGGGAGNRAAQRGYRPEYAGHFIRSCGFRRCCVAVWVLSGAQEFESGCARRTQRREPWVGGRTSTDATRPGSCPGGVGSGAA
jgi:hypothetical protein